MLRTVCLVAAVAAASGFADLDQTRQIRAQIIKEVNSRNSTWVAGENPSTMGRSYAQLALMCGAILNGPIKLPLGRHFTENPVVSAPDSFDVRDKWGAVCPSVAQVRDQSNCGSGWAVSAAGVASDRLCIGTNGLKTEILSSLDVLSCCTTQGAAPMRSCGQGCQGGFASAAMNWFVSTGIVTGGDYHNYTFCQSYPFAMCDHGITGQYKPCSSYLEPTPWCKTQCDAESHWPVPYSADKHVFNTSYSVPDDEAAIMAEIATYGSVSAAFTVYADFEAYTGGVYQHTSGAILGGQAVKIVGYGTDNGVKYWTVANSWNEDWGEKGYFRIVRGQDHCGIESEIVTVRYQ